ncbi:hypothetical protein ACET3Z_006935 [Daucus carota]
MATIRISDVKEKGKQFRNREKELMSNKIKVMEKIEDRLQHVEEEAIQEEIESADKVNKEVNMVNEEYKSLVMNCVKKITSGSVVTEENSEKDLKGAEEKDEVISSKYKAKQRELISSDENEVVAQDDKHIEKADQPGPLRSSKRTVKDPFWMKDYVVEKGRGKGKK